MSRFCPIFHQSCETKSRTESLGSRLGSRHINHALCGLLLPGLQELAALEREFEDRRVELEEEIDSLNKKVCGHMGMELP